MESTLNLQAQQDLRRVQRQSEEYYHFGWIALERAAHLEYSQSRAAQLGEVGRFEQGLMNRFAQSEQLAYNDGMRSGTTKTTLLRTELGQARRQASSQLATLRAELAQATSSTVTPEERGKSSWRAPEAENSSGHAGPRTESSQNTLGRHLHHF
eukprot:3263128-Amphidinium_carterae.1